MDIKRRLRSQVKNNNKEKEKNLKKEKGKNNINKKMLCQENLLINHQPKLIKEHNIDNNIICIDECDNGDEKTNTSSFKLKLSSSSSLSSSISSTNTTVSRVSTRQSMKTQISKNQLSKSSSCSSTSSSVSSTSSKTTTISSDTSSEITLDDNNNTKDDKIDLKNGNSSRKCLWHRCGYETSIDGEFMDHIQSKHVFSQKSSKKFRCLWRNCRVYKSQSSSFNWLERHVITHVDTKPFLCIINGCKRKFPTQMSLERHVNTHMKIYESPSKQQKLLNQQISTTSTTTVSNDSVKGINLNGNGNILNGHHNNHHHKSSSSMSASRKRKLIEASKYLKKAKYKDYVDEFTCKFVEQNLINMGFNNGVIKFRANILAAKNNENNDSRSYLVEWLPRNILDDEWINENDFKDTKEIDISKLKQKELTNDENQFYRRIRFRSDRRK